MIGAQGIQREAITNAFGYYRFGNVDAGATYIFGVRHKSWGITTVTQVQNIHDNRDDIDFVAPQ